MSQLSFPSLETVGKLAEWCGEAGSTFLSVLAKGPAALFAEKERDLAAPLPDAFRLAAFVVVVSVVVSAPIEMAVLKHDILSPTIVMINLVFKALAITVFTIAVHISAKAVGGSAPFARMLPAMLYASAYYVFFNALGYLPASNPALVESLRSGGFPEGPAAEALIAENPSLAVTLLVCLVFGVYVVIKLTPLVASVHGVGRIRSLLAVLLGCALYFLVIRFAILPIWIAFTSTALTAHP